MIPTFIVTALIVVSFGCSPKTNETAGLPDPPGWPPHLHHYPNNTDIPCPYDNRTKNPQKDKESRLQTKGDRGYVGGVGGVTKASFIHQRGYRVTDKQ